MKESSKIITVITWKSLLMARAAIGGTISWLSWPISCEISPLRFSQFPTFHRLHAEIDIDIGSAWKTPLICLTFVRELCENCGRITAGGWEKRWLENHGGCWWYHPPCYKLVSLDSKTHEYYILYRYHPHNVGFSTVITMVGGIIQNELQ